MTAQEQKFWRLFGNYEDLTRDQTTAVWEENFTVVEDLCTKKAVILNELTRVGALLGLHREHPSLKDRLTALISAERQNTLLLGEKLEKTRRDSETLDATAKRLRTIEHVYRGEPAGGTLCAHG